MAVRDVARSVNRIGWDFGLDETELAVYEGVLSVFDILCSKGRVRPGEDRDLRLASWLDHDEGVASLAGAPSEYACRIDSLAL